MMDPHSSSYHPLISGGFDPTLPSTHPTSPLWSSKRSNHHNHHRPPLPPPQPPQVPHSPFLNSSDARFPWQSYFSSDVTDKLLELGPPADSPQKAALDTSMSTQCTAQIPTPPANAASRAKPPTAKPNPKPKRKPKKKASEATEEKDQTTNVFVEDKTPEKTTSCCWGCCGKSSDQYTKMTHEETPQKLDNNIETRAKLLDNASKQHDSTPSPSIQRRKHPESVKKLEYMPQSPQLPDFRAYRHGHNGPMHSPYIPPDVVFKIYEHPMKYNNPSRQPNPPQIPAQKKRNKKPKQSSGEESSYFSSNEWEDKKDTVGQKVDTTNDQEEISSDPWSHHSQAATRKLMSSFKPELSKKDTPRSCQKTTESDESGKGPSDLSNEDKPVSNGSKHEQPGHSAPIKAIPVVIQPLTEANLKSMDQCAEGGSFGEVVEKTDVLSNSEQELSYKIYKKYRFSEPDDTDTTSGIANTFQSSHNQSDLITELIPLQRLDQSHEQESDVSFQIHASATPIMSPLSECSMSTESILDQSGDEFGVLTESDFYATGQESDATFGTLSSYGSRKKSNWLSSKERLLEMHPVLKLCQEDDANSNTSNNDTEGKLTLDNASSMASQEHRYKELDEQSNDINFNQHQDEPEFLPGDLPDPPDNCDTEGSFDSDGSLPPPPPPLVDDDGLTSEYSTLEMPVPMPLLHYSHLELTYAALDRLPDATPPTHLKRSFSNLSSPDSISKDSTVTMQSESLIPEPALHSQRYYSSSIDSSSNISDASEGPQTVVCAMVHSPCQPNNPGQEFDSDSLVKQLPSPDNPCKDTPEEKGSDSPKSDQGNTEKEHAQSTTTSLSQEKGSPPKTRHKKDKNCVLFDFDDKIVEEQVAVDTKPPRASTKTPRRSHNHASNPTSPAKSRRSSSRSKPKMDMLEERRLKHSRHKPQSPLDRMLLEFPSTSRTPPKKDSDTTTHSGSYGAGSYGFTDLSSGSTGLTPPPQRYVALPPMQIGKCVLKFGQKSPHSIQEPGHFSHPKAIDVFPNRDIAVLDSENCTLQIFTERGVCKKVYQFRSSIIDMIVWDSRTLALLKSAEISMFSLPRYEIDSLKLKDVPFPIALRKLSLPKQEPVFIVAMVTHVVVYTQRGHFLHTIPSHVDQGYGNLYIKRIGRIAVNPKLCDVIIVDMDLRTVYIFSWEGDHKYTIDTKYFPIGPIANPQGIGLDNLGNILIADSFNHRVVQIFQGGVRVLLQYHIEFFPCAVAVTRDNRLVVAMDCEGRSFAGVRVYNYRHALR